jgi:hypothetical protein
VSNCLIKNLNENQSLSHLKNLNEKYQNSLLNKLSVKLGRCAKLWIMRRFFNFGIIKWIASVFHLLAQGSA